MLDPADACSTDATAGSAACAVAAVAAATTSVCPAVISIAARKATKRRAFMVFLLEKHCDSMGESLGRSA
jgi:hypothetical protein